MRTRVADMLEVEFPICAFSHCRDVGADRVSGDRKLNASPV
jgi:hypothetical protein